MGISEKTCERIRELYKKGYAINEIAKTFSLREGIVKVIVTR